VPGPLQRLITVDRVDLLIGPYATGAILSRWRWPSANQKCADPSHLRHSEAGDVPQHFCGERLAFESEKVVPTSCWTRSSRPGAPETIAIVTSKFPSVQFISAGARDVATAAA